MNLELEMKNKKTYPQEGLYLSSNRVGGESGMILTIKILFESSVHACVHVYEEVNEEVPKSGSKMKKISKNSIFSSFW